ncbi:MAG TPA: hypothetical protein VG099_24805 [Gemmataceae bacterium]|jgi:hypothetical protein|nr:hypothetical protein [Gemmataceae bacterium]
MQVLAPRSPAPERKTESAFGQANHRQVLALHSLIETLVLKLLVRGFHGEAAIKFSVQDGVIQLIEERIGRKHR